MIELAREGQLEQQAERGEQDRAAREDGDDHRDQRFVGRRRLLDRQAGQQRRVLRQRPAGDDRGHGQRGGVARRLESPYPDQSQRGDAGEHRDDQRRQTVAGEQPVVERVGVGVQHREAAHGDRSGREPRAERACAELPLELGLPSRAASAARYTAAR